MIVKFKYANGFLGPVKPVVVPVDPGELLVIFEIEEVSILDYKIWTILAFFNVLSVCAVWVAGWEEIRDFFPQSSESFQLPQ